MGAVYMKLSLPQKSIYDMELYGKGAIAALCISMLIDGKENVEKLKYAANKISELNDALRLRVTKENNEIKQYVAEYKEKDIEVHYFDSEKEFFEFADKTAKKTVKLFDNELFDISVVVLPEKYGMLATFHHIIADAQTLAMVGTQFNALVGGEIPKTYSYCDYLAKEDKYINSQRYEDDRTFFMEQFKKCPEGTLISNKKATTNDCAERMRIIDKGKTEKLRKFAAEHNTSVFMLYMTAYGIYYSKINDCKTRFHIGTAVHNRSGAKEMNTMGMFVNTVPVLTEIDYDGSFTDNLKCVSQNTMSVFRHQKYNYNQSLQDLREQFNYKGSLYDVIISFQISTINKGENFKSYWHHNGKQNESLQIHFEDRDIEGTYKLFYDYQIEKFTEADIDNLHNRLMVLLEDAIENPNKPVSELNCLTEEEKKRIDLFNNTTVEYEQNKCIYQLFEETAKKNADKVCIKTDGKEITFGEFLNIAEQLDTKIRTYTKGEKCVVGVIADRSIEMYAAIYGIIRGGNAYMPISPDYPQDRIEYMLKNSKSPLCIAQGKYCSLAGENHINMTDFIKNLPKKDVVPFACEEDDTAYVIYTSGSTGKPKGAKVSHKSAVNRILWMHDKYPLTEDGVILQKTPYTFDVSVWEIFWWGMLGGCLAVSKPNEHFLPAKILGETDKNKVTHLHFVPSVFDLFLTHLESHIEDCKKFSTVKYVFLSGEALSASLIERFYKLFDCNKVSLHNLYGPTECAVDVTYYDCSPADCNPVPIGKPIYNTSMYVVDKYMKLVPVGVKGELSIGGVNVGQGYLNNPELTAEKFIDNPFGEGKLYKTGDLAYWREDGEIIFCGRMDNQVKLNGQRIELGEIESVIASVNKVDSVAVLVHKAEGRDILVAVCCADSGLKTAIIDKCREKLPAYMIPQAFTFIDEMPLNQSGKLDRKYLSTLSFITEVESIEKPLNETEKLICDAFCKVLNIDEIGRNSDFFDLGGTSITMISVLSDSVLESITAPEFIANSTPSKLSQLLEHKRKPTFKYIQKLSEPENSSKAFVLFPYAGGGAEVYSAFVKDFEKQAKDFAIFFVDFLHTKEACEKVAFEISRLAKTKEIYFYSHCAGSAVAMQTLNIIEANNLCSVKQYIAGGSLPAELPTSKNPWNFVPDFILKRILISAGASLKEMDKHHVTDMLKRFRKDTDFSAAYFYNKSTTKVACPLSLVMSKHDVFTKEYEKAEELWAPYVENVSNIHFIDTCSHYFQASNSHELVNIILNFVK